MRRAFEHEWQMNRQLSFQSSLMCESPASTSNVSAFESLSTPVKTPITIQDSPMSLRTLDPRKLMLIMACCLMVASFVPMLVVAAG